MAGVVVVGVQYIEVVLPLALPMDTLTYACSFSGVRVGVRVRVPLGRGGKMVVGVVSAVGVEVGGGVEGGGGRDGGAGMDTDTLKSVDAVLDSVPLVSEVQFEFFRWLSSYYMVPLGEILKMGLSPLFSVGMTGLRSRRKRGEGGVSGGIDAIRAGVFEGNNSGCDIALVRSVGIVDYGDIVSELQGTGSDGVVLVLCPTHKAVNAMAELLEDRFRVVKYTPQLPVSKRAKIAVDFAMGVGARVVIGTRAALWLNLVGLQGVLITQEHSYYYRSAAPPYVSGREAALVLGRMMGARCVVESAYPLVESYYNSRYGDWGYVELGGTLPPLQSIVLERGKDMLASYTRGRIAEVLAQGRKVVLLQNRRGVASFVECVGCGYVPKCPNCSVSLTLHRTLMGCHYCGYSSPVVENCVECGGGFENRGRGTQQIENQLVELFPSARVERIDSDSFADDSVTARDILGGRDTGWDILIGTALVVEELDWVGVGLVGVLNVDNMLSAADFRVEERAHRILGLLSLRCRSLGSEFVVQSSRLGHRCVDSVLSGGFDAFYSEEVSDRLSMGFPPHSRMLRFDLRGKSFSSVSRIASDLECILRPIFGVRLSSIYQPVVERQGGEYLLEMLLKIERGRSFSRAKVVVQRCLRDISLRSRKSGVSVFLEVDPV